MCFKFHLLSLNFDFIFLILKNNLFFPRYPNKEKSTILVNPFAIELETIIAITEIALAKT